MNRSSSFQDAHTETYSLLGLHFIGCSTEFLQETAHVWLNSALIRFYPGFLCSFLSALLSAATGSWLTISLLPFSLAPSFLPSFLPSFRHVGLGPIGLAHFLQACCRSFKGNLSFCLIHGLLHLRQLPRCKASPPNPVPTKLELDLGLAARDWVSMLRLGLTLNSEGRGPSVPVCIQKPNSTYYNRPAELLSDQTLQN